MSATPPPPANFTEAAKALEEDRKIMAAYSDTAKTYSQLSLGALVLSVTFIEKVAAIKVSHALNAALLLAWGGLAHRGPFRRLLPIPRGPLSGGTRQGLGRTHPRRAPTTI